MTNILFTGRGTSGSWQIRGKQLGAKVGIVTPKAGYAQMKDADCVIQVKRFTPNFIRDIRKAGTPWIWDLVDFYPQPECTLWSRAYAINWVRARIREANPSGLIYPNQQMKDDIGLPGEVIYHHYFPKIVPSELKSEIRTIGYIGAEIYLADWVTPIFKECKKRGWRFKTNTPISDLDLVIALRGYPHDGYVQTNWKSNVKLANAHAAGIPFIGQPEKGYLETASGHEGFITTQSQLSKAFDFFSPFETRLDTRNAFLSSTITLTQCAAQVKDYVETVLRDR